MRNIASINITNTPYELGYTNEGSDTNELILSIISNNLENPFIEVTKQNGSIENTSILDINNSVIEYSIPISYLYASGNLKIKVKADEYSSDYITFNIPETLNSSDDIKVKIENNIYSVTKVSNYKYYDLPIATKNSLGGIIVGDNLSITPGGVLSATGGGSGGSSNYNELTNKPSINGILLSGNKTTSDLGISIPTKTSELTNDSGFITSVPSEYITETELSSAISGKANKNELASVATSGSYNDLTNKPTLFNGNYNSLTNKPVINISSEDSSNPICLFDLEEGIYNINGYIKWYSTYTGTLAITSPTLMTVQKDSTYTYIQMFEPSTNEAIGYKISSSSYEKIIPNTLYAGGYDLAEIGVWADGNTNNEDRLYRFVSINVTNGGGNYIQIADSDDYITGVTTNHAGFIGNYSEGDLLDNSKAIVGLLGILTVKTNDSSISVNDKVMSGDNGYAVKSSNELGYRVLEVLDDGKLKIAFASNIDMIQRIKTDVINLEENKVDKVQGKGLSTNDYTTTEKDKLAGIESNAQVNKIENIIVNDVQTQVDQKSVRLTIPEKVSELENDDNYVQEVNLYNGAKITDLEEGIYILNPNEENNNLFTLYYGGYNSNPGPAIEIFGKQKLVVTRYEAARLGSLIQWFIYSNDFNFYFGYVDEADGFDYTILPINLIERKSNKVTELTSNSTDDEYPSAKVVYDNLNNKQDELVSGTNIKTINNQSILGSGNIEIESSGSGDIELTSPVRIWNLEDGEYVIPASCTIYYKGETSTSNFRPGVATGRLLITSKTDEKQFYIFARNGAYQYLYFGYTTSSDGYYNLIRLNSILTSINSYVKDNLTTSTSGTTYALSAYQGYVLDQNKQDKLTAGDNITIDENNVISANEFCYKSGDTYDLTYYGAGYLTNSGKDYNLGTIFTNKSLANISSIDITNGYLTVRQNNKYLVGSASSGAFMNPTYCHAYKAGDNAIRLVFNATASTTGYTNNNPIGVTMIDLQLTFN